jgi:hypothetical protein
VAYSERGTAVAESLRSLSDWSPEDWTGLTLNTLPVPALLPLRGFVAPRCRQRQAGHQAGGRGQYDGRLPLKVGHVSAPKFSMIVRSGPSPR